MQTILKALLLVIISYGMTAFLLKLFISFMKKRSLYQVINPDVEAHQGKENTPTAGGLCFIVTTTILSLIAADITQPYVFIPILSLWIFGGVGMADDLMKLRKKENLGLPSGKKFALQILAAAALYYIMKTTTALELNTVSAFWNPQTKIDIGLWFPIAFLLYMVIFVNAVNISDGLDGLATSVSISPLFLVFAIAILFAHSALQPVQPAIAEGAVHLVPVVAIVIGSLLAFLWFNGYQASIFMGDVGSHAIGGFIGVSALLMKVEIIVAISSGLIMTELLSSFLQIVSLRLYKKKIFLLAPLHHHFEKKGVMEGKIVTRFSIVSVLLTLLATYLFLIKYK